MTTGERLVALSTLSTGTAMDHFLNIECEIIGGGTITGGGSNFYSVDYINEVPEAIVYIPNSVSIVTYVEDDLNLVSYEKDEESEVTVISSNFVGTEYKN